MCVYERKGRGETRRTEREEKDKERGKERVKRAREKLCNKRNTGRYC